MAPGINRMQAGRRQWQDALMKPQSTLTALGALLAFSSLASADGWTVGGRIVDEDGAPIGSASIQVAGRTHDVDETGSFQIDIEALELVSLQVSADGYYGFIHTLHDSDAVDGEIDDFVIELVAREPQRRLLLFAGDAMLARRYFEPRPGEPVLVRPGHVLEDGKKLLEVIRPYVQLADYASVNVETQLSDKRLTQRLPKSVTFYSPPELADLLRWAGFDYAALGNNHTWDYQAEGLVLTLAALEAAGLDYSGAGLDEASARKAQSVELGDQPYRFLSYVGWAGTFEPTQSASGAKGGAALGNSKVFAEDLQTIDPSTVSVLQYHSGIEYAEMPAISERMRLREAIDNGADIAIGHHPHVLQGIEIYKDRLIAYSMGNFLFDQYIYSTQLGMLVYVWMDGDEMHRAEVVPLNINGYLPTPATGRFRTAILHRLARISRPLGTCMRANGANVLAERCGSNPLMDRQVVDIDGIEPKSTPVHLDAMGLTPLSPVMFEAPDRRYRLGTDILARGDFESEGLFGTADRAFILSKHVEFSDAESRVLRVDVPRGKTVRTGMRVFDRVFTISNPTTFTGRILASADVEINVILQRRRLDESLDEGLANDTGRVVGRIQVSAGGWRSFSVDFDQPRVSTRSVRLLLDVRAKNGRAEVLLDDLAWVEWRTPWLESLETPASGIFATHVQFQKQ